MNAQISTQESNRNIQKMLNQFSFLKHFESSPEAERQTIDNQFLFNQTKQPAALPRSPII